MVPGLTRTPSAQLDACRQDSSYSQGVYDINTIDSFPPIHTHTCIHTCSHTCASAYTVQEPFPPIPTSPNLPRKPGPSPGHPRSTPRLRGRSVCPTAEHVCGMRLPQPVPALGRPGSVLAAGLISPPTPQSSLLSPDILQEPTPSPFLWSSEPSGHVSVTGKGAGVARGPGWLKAQAEGKSR